MYDMRVIVRYESDYRMIIIMTDKTLKKQYYDSNIENINIISIDEYDTLFDIIKNIKPSIKMIDFVINSTGGEVTSNNIMAFLIRELRKKYTTNAHIYNYAMSAGTLLALACENIYMDDYSFLTPTDPQITILSDEDDKETYQSKDILDIDIKSKEIAFYNMLIYNSTKRYHDQNIDLMRELLRQHIKLSKSKKNLNKLLNIFTSGDKLHITPYNKHLLRSYGIPIYDQNNELKKLMDHVFNLLE